MIWNIYLSGEIHSDWREKIKTGLKAANLPVNLTSPLITLQVMIVATVSLVLKILLSGKTTRLQESIPFVFVT